MQEDRVSPITTVIVDDETLARELIGSLVRRDPSLELIGECGNGASALDLVARSQPDLLFLDVQMPVLDGLAVAERIARLPRPPFVIFVTAYDEYAIGAFELNALDYLVKPLSKQRFRVAVERAIGAIHNRELSDLAARLVALGGGQPPPAEQNSTSEHELLLRAGGEVVQLVTGDLEWIEAANQYVHIHTRERLYTVSESLGQYAKRIRDCRFFRIHRSAVVNGAAVRQVRRQRNGTHTLKLRGGDTLTLARSRSALVPNILRVARLEHTNG